MDGSSPLAGIAENAPQHGGTRESPARGDRRYLGRYELLARLGHGGMASVFLGRALGDAGFEKRVAVKLIHSHLADDPALVAMFHDEARIAAQIQHPNVVATLDLGGDQGRYFIALELVEGDTLAALLRATRGEPLSVCESLQIACDALAGLAAAHDLRDARGALRGVVHRDVSPQNLLVGADGYVKVADFGIAKASGKSQHTRPGELRGKLAYMAPEQARGEEVDARCDLFAVGAVLWELLSSQRYIEADSEAQLIAKLSQGRLPDPDSLALRDDIDVATHAELRAVLRRCLAADRRDRFADAHEMLAALRPLLQRTAGSTDPRQRLKATIRKHFGARLEYIQRIFHGVERDELDSPSSLSTPRPRPASTPTPTHREHDAAQDDIHTTDLRARGQERGRDAPLARAAADDLHTQDGTRKLARSLLDQDPSDAAQPPVLRTTKLAREPIAPSPGSQEQLSATRRPPTDGWLALPTLGPPGLEDLESGLPNVPGSGPLRTAASDWEEEQDLGRTSSAPWPTVSAAAETKVGSGGQSPGPTSANARDAARDAAREDTKQVQRELSSAHAPLASRQAAQALLEDSGPELASLAADGDHPDELTQGGSSSDATRPTTRPHAVAAISEAVAAIKPRRSVVVPAMLLVGAFVALLASVWIASNSTRERVGEDQLANSSVHWFFSSDPAGAEIWIDGQRIADVTPARVEVPRGERPLNVELRLAGYRPMRISIPPLSDQAFAYQLEPRAAGALPLAPQPKTTGDLSVEPASLSSGSQALVGSDSGTGLAPQLTVASPNPGGTFNADPSAELGAAGNEQGSSASKTGGKKSSGSKTKDAGAKSTGAQDSKHDSVKDGGEASTPPADFKAMPDFGVGGDKPPASKSGAAGDK